MLASTKPLGPVIVPGGSTKLKGATILQPLGQWPYWAQFWRDWDWPTISRTIDNLAGLGINCLQFTVTGLPDNGIPYPDDAGMRARLTQICGYAASKGMCINPQLGYQPQHTFGQGAAIGTEAAVRMMRLLLEQPNISFVDVMNEVNFFPAPGWSGSGPNAQALSDISYMHGAIAAIAGNIPLTWSTGASYDYQFTDAWSQAMAQFTAFHNVHAYNFEDGSTTFQIGDLAALRAAPWYKGRFVIGEIGVSSTRGTSLQTSWMTSAKNVSEHPECIGMIVWGATDTTGSIVQPGFGMFDSTGTTARPSLTVPISTWPGAI